MTRLPPALRLHEYARRDVPCCPSMSEWPPTLLLGDMEAVLSGVNGPQGKCTFSSCRPRRRGPRYESNHSAFHSLPVRRRRQPSFLLLLTAGVLLGCLPATRRVTASLYRPPTVRSLSLARCTPRQDNTCWWGGGGASEQGGGGGGGRPCAPVGSNNQC